MVLAGLGVFACGHEQRGKDMKSIENTPAKVRAYSDGRVTLNGTAVTLDGLPTAFADIKQKKSVVWYYRESGDSEPHPNAMAVIQAIIEAELPVSLSSKEDFSDVVIKNGSTKPRD